MNEPELLKRHILEADRLTIRQGLFLPNENGTFTELSPEGVDHLKEFMKEMNWKASYRVYFSIPYSFTVNNKIDSRSNSSAGDRSASISQSVAQPKGSISEADNYLRDVIPQWTRKIANKRLDSKFHRVDKKFENVWSELGVYIKNKNWAAAPKALNKIHKKISNLPGDVEITRGCSEDEVVSEFKSEINSELKRYLRTLDLEGGKRSTKFYLRGKPCTVHPDYAFTVMNDSKIHFFIEFKRHGLINYVDENGIKNNNEMKTIMKQASKYMIATSTDCCIISDIEVSILVQLDFEASNGNTQKVLQADGSIKIDAVVPFKYYVFHPNDTIYTFQAILCSVAYDQKLRAGDPIQKDNAERLKALMLKEDSELFHRPKSGGSRGSSESGSQFSHPRTASTMFSFTPSHSAGEQDSNPGNMGTNTSAKNTRQKSWTQYKQSKFYFNRGDFEVLQSGDYYLNTVLKLNRATIDRDLSHLNIPPSVPHVIMKFFSSSSSVSDSYCNEFEISYEEFESFMYNKFDTEVKCFIRTNTYNECRRQGGYLRVPKMHEFGGGFLKVGETILCFGAYLILEYLEKDADQRFNLEEAKYQLKLLESLGIQHNDIFQRNVIVSQGRFNLIDFSEAFLDEIDIHRDLENLERVWKRNLEEVWKKNSEQFREPRTSFEAHEEGQDQKETGHIEDINLLEDREEKARNEDFSNT